MKIIDNELQFSISDIVQYFKSPYASYATWSNLQNPGHISVENNLIQNSSLQLRSEENEADAKRYLINNYEDIKTDSYDQNLKLYLKEGRQWMKNKYGFSNKWAFQMYVKSFYDKFFENNPEYRKYKL